MLSTSQEGRGYPAGTMGARFTARGVPAGDEGAPIGLPEAVEVGRPDAVLGVVAHGVKLFRSGRWRGGCCAPWVSFLVWLLMVWSCLDRDGCADLQGLKRSGRVGQCASFATYTHIYNR